MNYRHAFHAGNFADVLKHAVLIGLLDALQRKPAAMCYLDSHAGRGRYDLLGDQATRTGEYRDGVQRLLDAPGLSGLARRYVDCVRALDDGQGDALRRYPGSPLLAATLLREQDRALLCELHPEEAQALKTLFRNDARIAVHQRDGYEALKALLPPAQKRGLVLIDPPFERSDEFDALQTALSAALARWPNGSYAIWYPIKLREAIVPLHRWLAQETPAKSVLIAELLLHADNTPLRLNGCGMALINPPWQFDQELATLLPTLQELLATGNQASHRLEWLVEP